MKIIFVKNKLGFIYSGLVVGIWWTRYLVVFEWTLVKKLTDNDFVYVFDHEMKVSTKLKSKLNELLNHLTFQFFLMEPRTSRITQTFSVVKHFLISNSSTLWTFTSHFYFFLRVQSPFSVHFQAEWGICQNSARCLGNAVYWEDAGSKVQYS